MLYMYTQIITEIFCAALWLTKVAGGFSSGLGPAQHRPRRLFPSARAEGLLPETRHPLHFGKLCAEVLHISRFPILHMCLGYVGQIARVPTILCFSLALHTGVSVVRRGIHVLEGLLRPESVPLAASRFNSYMAGSLLQSRNDVGEALPAPRPFIEGNVAGLAPPWNSLQQPTGLESDQQASSTRP